MSDAVKASSGLPVRWVVFGLIALVIVAAVFGVKSASTPVAATPLPEFLGPTVDTTDADVLLTPSIGRKRALLFGLDYVGSPYELRGSQEDVRNLGEVLRASGFDIEVCTEETAAHPTRNVIQAKLAGFLLDLAPGDMAVVWYSGHGILLGDGSNAWVPVDFQRSGFIDESWVRSHLAAVPEGVRILIGSDACHSGTTFDLKYDIEPKHVQAVSTAYKKVIATKGTVQRNTQTFREIAVDTNRAYEVLDAWTNRNEMMATIVVVSGCDDNEVSLEGFENGEMQGVMTWAFLESFKSAGGTLSLGALQDMMRAQLAEHSYAQVPQLSFSRLFSPKSTLAAFGVA